MQIIKRSNILEVCTDASMKDIAGHDYKLRPFGAAGAVCINTDEMKINICPDSTNNRAELIAIYTGIQMAESIYHRDKCYDKIIIYSDSQFSIFGLTKWMPSWLQSERNGILFNSSGKPVMNQELFKMIIIYSLCYSSISSSF